MSLTMPALEHAILAQRGEIVRRLEALVRPGNVLANEREMRPYECDALAMYQQMPLVVVLPETVEEVSKIMALAAELNVKVVPRGSGTSLSGGSLPLGDGILLAMGKFNKILEIDYENRCAVVQPGVPNLAISKAVESDGFYYAPDPSSQIACSIGGNVAENSGGVHCLKYGLTTNNILGLEMVLMGGEVIRLGGKHLDSELYDLMGVMTGSEGLLGVVTEVTVRILKKPAVARGLLLGFPSVQAGGDCVAAIIAAGIIPGGLEMMDQASIVACESYQPCGYPLDCASLVIAELDGTAGGGRSSDRTRVGDRARTGRELGARLAQRGRAPAILAGPQERLSRGCRDRPRLSLHGRHDPAQRIVPRAPGHGRPRGEI